MNIVTTLGHPNMNNTLTFKYPKYSLTSLLSVLGEEQDYQKLLTYLRREGKYWSCREVTEEEFKDFFVNWQGEELDSYKERTWLDHGIVYVFTKQLRLVGMVTAQGKYFLKD